MGNRRLDREEVRAANRLEDVIPALTGYAVSTNGTRELVTRCPWHEDQHPSLRVNPEKQVWRCDPCDADAGGDVFAFVEKFRGVDFKTALSELAERTGLTRTDAPSRREVIAYDYRNQTGALLFQSVRFEPKDFRQRRPDGHDGWTWNVNGTRRVLYRLPELKDREAVLVCEGEKDADRAWALGLPATTNVGGAGKWRDEYTAQLVAAGVKRVVVLPDNDDPGRAHADHVARNCHAAGLHVRLVALPGVPDKGDLSDYLTAHGKAELLALLKGAPVYQPPRSPAEPTPSTASATTQPKASKKSKETAGRALKLEDPEEWPNPVAIDTLLDVLASLLTAFVVFVDPSHADALALWILHTYLMDAWSISPLAVVHSPTMRCGKTTVLQLTAHLASRALAASNISPAALFRAIERYRPTLLLDEAETFLKENEELRGLVNAGHTRKTAVVIRTVGEQHEAAAFSTWCPKFIALIGRLAPTLMDRSIVIPMRRRMAGESVERLRLDRLDERCVSLRRQAVRWANDTAAQLQAADPYVPPELDDRAADNWRPLLAIAEAAGGAWVTRARTAAVALSRHDDGEQGLSIQLLSDVREVLKGNPPLGDTIVSAELVRALVALEDRPWPTCAKLDKPLTPNGLARLLKPFGIVPTGNLRIGDKVLKGYRLNVFEEAWDRYLLPFQPLHRYKPNNDGLNSQFPTATRPSM
jgi:hypothetical protein